MAGRAQKVKTKRAYDSSRRQAAAEQTRNRIVDVAERRFLQHGYRDSTLADIAAEAAVSVDTIHKSFGGKPGLVRAIRARRLEGAGPIPAETRSDALHDQHRDPRDIIRAWGQLTAEVAPRVAPILLLVSDAAAHDPEMRSMQCEIDDARHDRMAANARRLRDARHLRAGVTLAQATDVLWTYSSPELYDLLVLRRRWPLQRYAHFVADAIIAALL